MHPFENPLGAMGSGEDIGAAAVYLATGRPVTSPQTLHVQRRMVMP